MMNIGWTGNKGDIIIYKCDYSNDFAALIIWSSPYLGWEYSDPETAALGVAFHSFEWLFVRVAPIIFIAAIIGIFFTFKKEWMDKQECF